MTNTNPMTRLELIRLMGDVLTEVDVMRSNFSREDANRKQLDTIREKLDIIQHKLVRSIISDNTEQFKTLTVSLKEINTNLNQTIEDVDKTAETLETLVNFVGVVEKIAELMP